MSQGKKNICFYSNSDKWSKAFIEELASTPWIREFEFICVDPGPSGSRPSLPKWLKQVPTLVINGDEEPVKTDTNVMNWLYERKMREMPKKTVASEPMPATGGDPASFIGNEMKGYGNAGYSFIDSDTSTGGNGGATIPGTFTFLNGSASPGDRTGQGDNIQSQSSRSKKEKMFDKQYDMYKQQRDEGMPRGPVRQ
jgi:hypothetical protein